MGLLETWAAETPGASACDTSSSLCPTELPDALERALEDIDLRPALGEQHHLERLSVRASVDVGKQPPVAVTTILGRVSGQCHSAARCIAPHRRRRLGSAALLTAVDLGRVDTDQADPDPTSPLWHVDVECVAVDNLDYSAFEAKRLEPIWFATASGCPAWTREGLTGDSIAVTIEAVAGLRAGSP